MASLRRIDIGLKQNSVTLATKGEGLDMQETTD
jgi:hypothetical protein